MSIQCFHLFPKIREIDSIMNPALQSLVFESHPELGFSRLAGHPMEYNKKTVEGRRERLGVLADLWNVEVNDTHTWLAAQGKKFPRRWVGWDDVLDAAVLAHTACRIMMGRAARMPEDIERDGTGLRMEVWS